MLRRKKPLTRKAPLRAKMPLRTKTAMRSRTAPLIDTADDAARKLWLLLAERPGPPFCPNERLGPYVADFVCPAARLVILIANEDDPQRQDWLIVQGYRVLSFAADATCRDPQAVLDAVAETFVPRVIKS